MDPRKIYTPAVDIVTYELQFPSGKTVILGRTRPPYITSDPDEIDFASRQTGLAVTKLNDKEFRTYASTLTPEKPSVENRSLTPVDADEFRWNADEEARVIEELKKRGWTIYKKKTEK